MMSQFLVKNKKTNHKITTGMIEIIEENKEVGIFNPRQLVLEPETRKEIFEFVNQNRFFVLILNDYKEIKCHPVIKQMEQKGYCTYKGIVITINGNGMEVFRDMFDRSISYVDQRMIKPKDFKKIFEPNEDVIKFFDDIVKNFGECQIKGMKKILLQKKFRKLV